MVIKKTGISRDLIIHPGETISDVLEERDISQAELAKRTDVSTAYISNVIAGKKDISANFAMKLEYALGVPKSFWLNLQANYDAELLELTKEQTITDDERNVRNQLSEVIKYLRNHNLIPKRESIDQSILSLRTFFQVSNIANIGSLQPTGSFRLSETTQTTPYVLGAWIRLCQLRKTSDSISSVFTPECKDSLISELKSVMLTESDDIHSNLKSIMARYGIDFSIVANFRGAPVHGYISKNSNGIYKMALTIRGAYADIFWFSLFHELGHIFNGDLLKTKQFIGFNEEVNKEHEANNFARDNLLNPIAYKKFVDKKDFSIKSIQKFASSQNVQPYFVIGRLQKEKFLSYKVLSNHKTRYTWAN